MTETTDSPVDRCLRVVDYLRKLAGLGTKVVRDLEQYEKVIWIDEVPTTDRCGTALDGADDDPDFVLQVTKPRPNEFAPLPPAVCGSWYDADAIARFGEEPQLFPERWITEVRDVEIASGEDGRPVIESVEDTTKQVLEDEPEVCEAWERWLQDEWRPWAARQPQWVRHQRVYTSLFQMHREQEKRGEQLETMLGVACVVWKPTGSELIRRHVLAARVVVEFERKSGTILVRRSLDQPTFHPEIEMLPGEALGGLDLPTLTHDVVEAEPSLGRPHALHESARRIVHSASPDAQYVDDDMRPAERITDTPRATFAPAIILRRRSQRGFDDAMVKIRAQLEAGCEIPPGFAQLCELPASTGTGHGGESTPSPNGTTADPVYFPLAANDEQRKILERLDHRNGVLVQGPPGTGKSHTIANLISHLLAVGRRILVTAQTPRALQVLRGKLPPRLRDLCVSLLGSDREEQDILHQSVQSLCDGFNDFRPEDAKRKIEAAEAQRADLRRRRAGLEARIVALRQSETRVHDLGGGYRGTLATIVQRVRAEESAYGWLIDEAPDEAVMSSIGAGSIETVRHLLASLSDERRAELLLSVPDGPAARDAAAFERLVAESERLDRAGESLPPVAAEDRVAFEHLSGERLSAFESSLDEVRNAIRPAWTSGQMWLQDAVWEVLPGRGFTLDEKVRHTRELLDGLLPRARFADGIKVAGPSAKRLTTLADAERRRDHLASGGFRGLWRLQPRVMRETDYLDDIIVDGRRCSDVPALEKLIDNLKCRAEVKRLCDLWSREVDFSSITGLAARVVEVSEAWSRLERVVAARKPTEALRALSHEYAVENGDPSRGPEALERAIAACRLALHRRRCDRRDRALAALVAELEAGGEPHNLVAELRLAVSNRDVDAFRSAAIELQTLDVERERLRHAEQELDRLSEALPSFAAALRRSPAEEVWSERIAALDEAVSWRRAEGRCTELLAEDDAGDLETELKQVLRAEKDAVEDLAASRAWARTFERMTEQDRERLQAWENAVKNIKKTGKHVESQRATARRHLDHCRGSIPAWVMPLYRMWETVEPKPGMFDVVIVDEASQCGPDAFPLFFLAKKIVIVGDDEQISPEYVGIERERVYALIRQYLAALEFRDHFHLETSLFANGARLLGDRIVLREHFRCVPEIIRFNNDLCYQRKPMIPLRQAPPDRLEPLVRRPIGDGYVEGKTNKVNPPEAEALVAAIADACSDPRYAGKSMGVISLQGNAQAPLIQSRLLETVGPEEIENRKLVCGDAYSFQGDERDVIFLSLVAAPNSRIGTLSKDTDRRRFNVAVSRARDQIWLFHTATLADLSPHCLRHRLLSYFLNPVLTNVPGGEVSIEDVERQAHTANRAVISPPRPFESWFEVDVYLEIVRRGFDVVPQFEIGNYRIDLVVQDAVERLAVECDGDKWHETPEQYVADMARQRKLEGMNMTFWRVRGSRFYSDREKAMASLWDELERRGMGPYRRPSPRETEAVRDATEPEERSADKSDATGVVASDTPRDFVASETVESNPAPAVRHETSEGRRVAEAEQITPRAGGALPGPLASRGRSAAQQSQSSRESAPLPFIGWTPRPLPDPRTSEPAAVVCSLSEIIEAEGPVMVMRVYQLYVKDSPFRLAKESRSALNKRLGTMVRRGEVLLADELGKKGYVGRFARLPHQPEVQLRSGGDRSVEQIPPSEVVAMARHLFRKRKLIGDTGQCRDILRAFGLRKLTQRAQEYISNALANGISHPDSPVRVVPVEPAPPTTDELTEEDLDAASYVSGVRDEVWLKLSHWSKEKGLFAPWERRILYAVGARKRSGTEPTYKQCRHAARLHRAAMELGFE